MDSPNEVVGRLLVVHGDSSVRSLIAALLNDLNVELLEAESFAQAIQQAGSAMMLSGVLLSAEALCRKGLSTNDVLGTIRTATGTEEIIVLIDTALDLDISRRAIEGGISGFVNVGGGRVDKQALRRHVMAAVRRTGERRGQHGAFQEFKAFDDGGFIARSPLMAEVLSKTIKAAKISDVPVIIYGESGTGKQLLAEMIQRLDPKRCRRRFLAVNCASISGTLADSELFGHVKGAFTGATENRLGHFRAADGGTMLLDEIGELDPALQPKLLRVLQEGVVCPVGSDKEIAVDVRVIAATHRRLPTMIEQGTFRLDLYQRLNVIVLEIPPLRERPEDIPPLIQFFLKKYVGYYHSPILRVDSQVHDALAQQPLAGNVRELENAVRQMLAFKTHGDELTLADLEAVGYDLAAGTPDVQVITNDLVETGLRLLERGQISLPTLMEQLECRLLTQSVRNSTCTAVDLAKRLGLSRRTFYNKLRKYRL